MTDSNRGGQIKILPDRRPGDSKRSRNLPNRYDLLFVALFQHFQHFQHGNPLSDHRCSFLWMSVSPENKPRLSIFMLQVRQGNVRGNSGVAILLRLSGNFHADTQISHNLHLQCAERIPDRPVPSYRRCPKRDHGGVFALIVTKEISNNLT